MEIAKRVVCFPFLLPLSKRSPEVKCVKRESLRKNDTRTPEHQQEQEHEHEHEHELKLAAFAFYSSCLSLVLVLVLVLRRCEAPVSESKVKRLVKFTLAHTPSSRSSA